MNLKSITTKLGLAVGACCLVIIGVLVGYTTIAARKQAIESAQENALEVAKDHAGHIKAEIEVAMNAARTLAQAFSAVKDPDSPLEMGRDPANAILQTVLTSNNSFLATYTVWEPEAFDQMDVAYAGLKGHDSTGRFIPYWTKDADGKPSVAPVVGYQTEGIGNDYLIPKNTMKEAVIDPHLYPVQGKDVLITSLAAPITYGHEFFGIVGVDMSLAGLQEMIEERDPYDGKAQITVISNNGTIAAASGQRSLAGKYIGELHRNCDWEEELRVLSMGKEIIEVEENNLCLYTPLTIGNTETPWAVNITIPLGLITAKATSQMWKQLFIGAALAALAILSVIFFVNRFMKPLGHIAKAAENVSLGDLDYKEIETADDEIGKVNVSFRNVANSLQEITSVCEAISVGNFNKSVDIRSEQDVLGKSVNQMAENLRAVVKQADTIAKGDYSVKVQPRSEHDELANALTAMTRSLKDTSQENERQNLLKTGQMKLNENMRGEQDLTTLAQGIIAYLCEYLGAQMGALYISDEDKVLNLLGSYAYQERKNLSNKFKAGEGLVGQAALERKPILVAQVPDDYIRIQSGLGEALPSCIVVVPLLYENTVRGVVELGAFQDFADFKMTFLNQVADSIAIAINSVQSRSQTTTLLDQTQQQAEKLQTQQEELRASNEELEEQTKALRESEAGLQTQQEELQQTNEELEEQAELLEGQKQEIQAKNLELENAQRLLAQKASDLEIAGKYKSEFLANMSHELRTPLNSILLLSKLLLDNKDGNLMEKQVEHARTVYSSGYDLLNLINDVLDLSKVEAGRMDLHVEDVDLSDFAGNMKQNFQPVAEEKNLDLGIDLADDLPPNIHTDQPRIEQIVKNLLSNAFKFTSQGSVTLSISRADHQVDLSRSGLDPRKAVSISISDTGAGIPKDKQRVIFEAFQQVDGTTSRKHGGTGLGLSISREMAKLLGGEIQLQSEEGKGSTFTLYLPERLAESREKGETENSKLETRKLKLETRDLKVETGKEEPETGMQGQVLSLEPQVSNTEFVPDDRKKLSSGDKSILIIEDDAKFAKLFRDLSHEKGFKVLIAEDGETGLHFADYYKPSAIVLDIGLPGIDGWTVMSRLKENLETRHIPVHFISASDNSLDAMKMGGIGYLTKPVSMDGLREVFGRIEHVISRPVKNLLLVEDEEIQRELVMKLIGNGDVRVTSVLTGQEAYDQLKSGDFDCMILDLGLPDMSGVDLLAKIRNDEDLLHLPIVVYTGIPLTKDEELTIDKYAEKIIVKGVKSPERLLDETALFLHRVEKTLPEEKRKMLRIIHDKESILKDKKILLVDDDMRNVYALENILDEKGMQILIGKNGKEALQCLNEIADISLILMDLMMPEMDGFEAMKEIRKHERFKKLPIIALTAKAMTGDRAKCIEAGANDYLAKPVDADKLLSMLRVWLY